MGRRNEKSKNSKEKLAFDVLTTVISKNTVFGNVTPCSLADIASRFGFTS
jgi:hypothetical protein